ncbi:hypothetical protein F2P56_003913 [Juglans regia]|uniref:Chromo domain-containing protein n=1 Tax=Juglans regia TaxID=51240 RepID=A0A833Y5T6_JUGRE|nr:hypothetical protein F2P56_003913 [Juglans regia]
MDSYHIEGEALIWYKDAFDTGQFRCWKIFSQALQQRFGPRAYDDPMEALTRLKQTSTVAVYKGQFEALSNRLKGLSETHKLSCFLSGLKDEIRLPLRLLNPVSLNASPSSSLIESLDSGSTHNFLDPSIIKRTTLQVNEDVHLKVQVANGDIVKTLGYCSEFLWCGKTVELKGLKLEETSFGDCHKMFINSLYKGKGLILQLNAQPALEGTSPISTRPYRYPYYQKTEIEKIVADLLKTGVIRPSSSPFSSPVLLVCKADGSWHLCVDYRALNKETVKDKFSIPVIDELLDELHEATVFSKLDLRSGYHQIGVVPRIFLKRPSELMRTTMSSCTMEQHIGCLQQVLKTLSVHHMFAKLSNCQFGVHEVDYLGHIVSGQGVKADPEKVEAMIEWPTPLNTKSLRGFLGLTGSTIHYSSAYHPETDGQIEALNKTLEGTAINDAVDKQLRTRDQINTLLKQNLEASQQRMKLYVDRRRTKRYFMKGDCVYLRLQLYRQNSLSGRHNLKLSPQFYRPFQIVQRVGRVAYKLDLLPSSRIHPIFHVFCLKRKLGSQICPLPTLPPINTEGELLPELEAIIDRRIKRQGDKALTEVLVKWIGASSKNNRWEQLWRLKELYPNLVGKVL